MKKWLSVFVCASIAVAVFTSFFLIKQQFTFEKSQDQFLALRLATTYGKEHPNTQTVKVLANLVRRESENQLALELFCDRELGDAPQLLEQLKFGGVALAVVDSITLSQQIPQLSELLTVTPGLEPAQAQQELLARQEEISALLQQEQLDLLAVYLPDYRVIATASHTVRKPMDFAGLRLYQPSRSAAENGALSVQMKWEDLPQSIVNNYADGGEMTLLEYTDADYQLMMPYLTLQSEVYGVDFLLASQVSMGNLGPESQQLIHTLAQETLEPQTEFLLKSQRKAIEKLSQNAVQVYPPKLIETDVSQWIALLADDPWLLKGGAE